MSVLLPLLSAVLESRYTNLKFVLGMPDCLNEKAHYAGGLDSESVCRLTATRGKLNVGQQCGILFGRVHVDQPGREINLAHGFAQLSQQPVGPLRPL